MTKTKTPRPARGKTPLVAFRFPDDLTEQIDRYVKELEDETPGQIVSRSDAVRRILYSFFAANAPKRAERK